MLGSGEAGGGGARRREKHREGRGREGKFLLIVNQTNELASLLINTRFELRRSHLDPLSPSNKLSAIVNLNAKLRVTGV